MEQGRGSSMRNRFTSFDRIREYGKMNKKKREYHETDRKVSDGRERSLSAEWVEKTSRQLLLTGTLDGLLTVLHAVWRSSNMVSVIKSCWRANLDNSMNAMV